MPAPTLTIDLARSAPCAVGQVTIRNVHVHHNACRGLWADMNAHDALIEYNLVEDNYWSEGVLYEISRDAVIR